MIIWEGSLDDVRSIIGCSYDNNRMMMYRCTELRGRQASRPKEWQTVNNNLTHIGIVKKQLFLVALAHPNASLDGVCSSL